MAEASFGIAGKDFVILAADCQQSAFGIIRVKDDSDKIQQVENMLFATLGPSSDTTAFTEYISKNIILYKLRYNGMELSTKAAASFTRNELAGALRRGPYQVNMLIAGMDDEVPQLYFLDIYASMEKVNKAAHGYGAMFTFGLLDRFWHPDITEEEGIGLIKKCIKELETRFLVNLGRYTCKIVDKNGPRVIELYDEAGNLKP